MDTVNIYRLSFVSCLVMAMPCAMAVEFNLNVLDKSMRDRKRFLNQDGLYPLVSVILKFAIWKSSGEFPASYPLSIR